MTGLLEEEDEEDVTNRWLRADLGEHGEIRIRLSKTLGRALQIGGDVLRRHFHRHGVAVQA